jgi:hypothetical protein
MQKTMLLLAAVAILTLAGCASPILHYPTNKDTLRISVSAETRNTWTQIPSWASLIDHSQVYIVGNKGTAGFIVAFGFLGGAIQKSVVSSTISEKSPFEVKFDSVFKDLLQLHAARLPNASRFKYSITRSENVEDIWVRPSAWFITSGDSSANLLFAVEVHYLDEAGTKQYKSYWSREGVLPLSGSGSWSEDNGALFKKAYRRSLDRIAQVILRDIAGECGKEGEYVKHPLIQWQPTDEDKPRTSNLLCEQPDYYVTNGSDASLATWFPNLLIIADRSLEPIIK